MDPRSHGAWLASRPSASESDAVRLVARLALEYGARVHVVHLSSPEGADVVRAARRAGAAVTAATGPQHPRLSAGDVPGGAPQFKCAPPLRSRPHRQLPRGAP